MWITDDGEKLVWCEDCKNYIDIKDAKAHNLPKEYYIEVTCPWCDDNKTFFSPQEMKWHLQDKH